MNIKLNKKSISMIAVYAIILVVYILVFCLIPFPKIAASYISFAFTIVSILASLGITAVAFKDDDAWDMAKAVAQTEGLPIGISAGAAMVAAVELASREDFKDKNIVVILPDAINNYISEL